MSTLLNFAGMPGSKRDKHYANTKARRESIVISQGKKRKKDTDTESVSSSADTVVPVPAPPPPPAKAQCPLRTYIPFLFEMEEEEDDKKADGDKTKKPQCPVKRVRLSHSLILAFLIAINTAFVIVTLLITLICRGAVAFGMWINTIATGEFSKPFNMPAPKEAAKPVPEDDTPAEHTEPVITKERRNSKSSIAPSHISA